jgi:hypothetical protein
LLRPARPLLLLALALSACSLGLDLEAPRPIVLADIIGPDAGDAETHPADATPADAAPADAELRDAAPLSPGRCDLYTQRGCGADEVCAVDAYEPATGVVGACAAGRDGNKTNGQVCTPSANAAAYFGDCTAAHLCLNAALGLPPTCVGVCDVFETTLCTGGSVCVTDIDAEPAGLGVCLGECNPLDDRGDCGPDQVCVVSPRGGVDAEGAPAVAGLCRPGNATLLPGGPCTVREGGGHDCPLGHACVPFGLNMRSICLQLCADDRPCPAMQACDQTVHGRAGQPPAWLGVCR